MSKTTKKQAERNFATHSDLSVEIQDKIDRLKGVRNVLTLIGCMIDTFTNTTSDVDKKVARKSRNEARTCHNV